MALFYIYFISSSYANKAHYLSLVFTYPCGSHVERFLIENKYLLMESKTFPFIKGEIYNYKTIKYYEIHVKVSDSYISDVHVLHPSYINLSFQRQ